MNWSKGKAVHVVVAVLALAVWFHSSASNAVAEQKSGGLMQQIQGNWVLVSIVNEQDGKKTDVFGPNPRGSLMLTPDGRFSFILMRASLPKFAANNRAKGTAQENEAVVQGSVAYFGTYKVQNEAEKIVSLSIEGSTFPNWDGEVQKRVMIVSGDEMKLTNPTAAIGGTNTVIWKRAK